MELSFEKRKAQAFMNASINMGLTVLIGAFGAHGLQSIEGITEKAIHTFQTGVTYHQLHGLGLFILPVLGTLLKTSFPWAGRLFLLGIILFSGCCYLYAITGVKFFAMIVPLGGFAFVLGWLSLAYSLYKFKDSGS